MVAIQQIAAEIGRVTGAGIARNLRRHYPRPVLWTMVTLLLIANIVNLGADLSAMGAALVLLTGGNAVLYTLLFGIICVLLEVTLSYSRYAAILKWTTLSLFAYVRSEEHKSELQSLMRISYAVFCLQKKNT